MEIHIDGDRGKLSLQLADDDLELGFLYDGEEYFMQVDADELLTAIEILTKEKIKSNG